jgi:hypothetical protein
VKPLPSFRAINGEELIPANAIVWTEGSKLRRAPDFFGARLPDFNWPTWIVRNRPFDWEIDA